MRIYDFSVKKSLQGSFFHGNESTSAVSEFISVTFGIRTCSVPQNKNALVLTNCELRIN